MRLFYYAGFCKNRGCKSSDYEPHAKGNEKKKYNLGEGAVVFKIVDYGIVKQKYAERCRCSNVHCVATQFYFAEKQKQSRRSDEYLRAVVSKCRESRFHKNRYSVGSKASAYIHGGGAGGIDVVTDMLQKSP